MSAPVFDFISIPAFLLAWGIHFSLGGIWYSRLLFGKAFIRLAHHGKQQKPDSRALAIAAMGSAIAMPFFCFILSVASCQSLGEGMLWGAAFGLFFDSGLNVSHSFFENRPFALFVLHRGYHACSLMLVGGALGALCGSRAQ